MGARASDPRRKFRCAVHIRLALCPPATASSRRDFRDMHPTRLDRDDEKDGDDDEKGDDESTTTRRPRRPMANDYAGLGLITIEPVHGSLAVSISLNVQV